MDEDTKFRLSDPFLLNIWLGYIFWSLLLELISSVYYLNLATLAINSSISLLLFIFLPALLGIIKIRDFMAKHFKGRVKAYESWNEPGIGKYEDLEFYCGHWVGQALRFVHREP